MGRLLSAALVVPLAALVVAVTPSPSEAAPPADAAAVTGRAAALPPADVLPPPPPVVPPVVPPSEEPLGPTLACGGVDELLTGPGPGGGDEPCASAYRFTDELSLWEHPTERVLGGWASAVLSLSATITRGTAAVVQWAFAPDLVAGLSERVAQVVGALRAQVYEPFVLAVVALAGVYGAWHGVVRRRGTVAVEGWVWTLCALVFALWFMARPAALLDGADAAAGGIGRAVLDAVAVVDPSAGADVTGAAAGAAALERAGGRIHRVLVHEPWAVGQFGDAAVADRHADAYLLATSITRAELARARGDPAAVEALIAAKAEEREALARTIADDHPEVDGWFRGEHPIPRLAVASASLAASVALGVVLVSLAAGVIALQVAGFLLVATAPVFLLLGAHPGAGRRMALRWLEVLAGVVLKRIVLSVLLAVVIAAYGIVLGASAERGWVVSVLLIVLLGGVAVAQRRTVTGLFGRVSADGAIHRLPSARSRGADDGRAGPLAPAARPSSASTAPGDGPAPSPVARRPGPPSLHPPPAPEPERVPDHESRGTGMWGRAPAVAGHGHREDRTPGGDAPHGGPRRPPAMAPAVPATRTDANPPPAHPQPPATGRAPRSSPSGDEGAVAPVLAAGQRPVPPAARPSEGDAAQAQRSPPDATGAARASHPAIGAALSPRQAGAAGSVPGTDTAPTLRAARTAGLLGQTTSTAGHPAPTPGIAPTSRAAGAAGPTAPRAAGAVGSLPPTGAARPSPRPMEDPSASCLAAGAPASGSAGPMASGRPAPSPTGPPAGVDGARTRPADPGHPAPAIPPRPGPAGPPAPSAHPPPRPTPPAERPGSEPASSTPPAGDAERGPRPTRPAPNPDGTPR